MRQMEEEMEVQVQRVEERVRRRVRLLTRDTHIILAFSALHVS